MRHLKHKADQYRYNLEFDSMSPTHIEEKNHSKERIKSIIYYSLEIINAIISVGDIIS